MTDTDPTRGTETATPSRRQIAILAAIIIAYAALAHYSNEEPQARGLGAALSVGPVLLIALFLAWLWLPRFVAAVATLATLAALVSWWPAIKRNYEWADLAQQCGIYALVAWGFARTLLGGRVPTCAQIAMRLHGPLDAAESAYLRAATLAWAGFYLILSVLILVLYFIAPLSVWSLFVNFVTFGLIALMALVDHTIRQRVLPPRHSGGLLTALRQALFG
jgi:uncharacterized membrane protein